MSKALIVAFRDRRPVNCDSFRKKLNSALEPSNLVPQLPHVHQQDGVVSFVFNPSPVVRTAKASVCLGHAVGSTERVLAVGAERPEGTFALFRADAHRIEVLTDYAGSRTIWYVTTPELFAAATSQRMIVAVLGSFQFNVLCVKWLLTNGITGPGVSWDKRLRMIPPNSTVSLDREAWTADCSDGSDFTFVPENRPFSEHRKALQTAVESSIQSLDLNTDQWSLALSGGMDSRSLLYFLKDKPGTKLITWGTEGALRHATSDASIAQQLAVACNLPHQYFVVQSGQIPFQTTLDRFLRAGEGRVDHFSGYLDGLALWAQIASTGRGVLRGYDAFGRKPPVGNEYHARLSAFLMLSSDYLGRPIPLEFAVSEADIPERLRRKPAESLEDWRDRIWLEHRTPNVTAALDEIKAPYVEIINPLLCRRIVDVVRRLPATFRNDKMIFASLVREMFPSVPFANRYAIEEHENDLERETTLMFFEEVLRDSSSESVLPAWFRATICSQLNSFSALVSLKQRAAIAIKARLPRSLENAIRRRIPREPMHYKRLAARAVMAIQMHKILTTDAQGQLFRD